MSSPACHHHGVITWVSSTACHHMGAIILVNSNEYIRTTDDERTLFSFFLFLLLPFSILGLRAKFASIARWTARAVIKNEQKILRSKVNPRAFLARRRRRRACSPICIARYNNFLPAANHYLILPVAACAHSFVSTFAVPCPFLDCLFQESRRRQGH